MKLGHSYVMNTNHSTGILPVFLNMSRILEGSELSGAALKLKSTMAEVKTAGQRRRLQEVLKYI